MNTSNDSDNNNDDDRRQHSRYPAEHLKVMARSLRNSGDWEFGSISSVDFNRYGIALETRYNFAVGDILALVIKTDDATLAEVNGLICNRTITSSGYRFGIRFEHEGCEDEEATDAVINIREEILMIEKQAAGVMH